MYEFVLVLGNMNETLPTKCRSVLEKQINIQITKNKEISTLTLNSSMSLGFLICNMPHWVFVNI